MSESRIVAAVQMVSGKDLGSNLRAAEQAVRRAVAQGAQLVVLPECFALMSERDAAQLGQREAGSDPVVGPFLSRLAATCGCWIVGGTVPWAAPDGRSFARVRVFDPVGDCRGHYDKVHLFDADVAGDASYRESDRYCPGGELLLLDTELGRLGVCVCYDIRFPEMQRAMAERGMDILAVPAAFTRRTGLAHWLPLLRARAIENQCLVVAANQGGAHGKRLTSGGSVLIDHWGRVLGEAGLGETEVVSAWDAAAMASLRKDMPVAGHRRFQVQLPDNSRK